MEKPVILSGAEWKAWYLAQSVEVRCLVKCLVIRLMDREGYAAPVAANAVYNLVIHAAEDMATDDLVLGRDNGQVH